MNPRLHLANNALRKSLSRRPGWPYSLWIFGALLTLVSVALPFIRSALADDPRLTISLVSSNQLQIVITNAVPGQIYEIHRRPLFIEDPEYQWKIHLIGTNNTQTNFTAFMGVDVFGFFRAQQGTDADGDGILDWFDANPTNASVSTLFITIDNPTNGAVIY